MVHTEIAISVDDKLAACVIMQNLLRELTFAQLVLKSKSCAIQKLLFLGG